MLTKASRQRLDRIEWGLPAGGETPGSSIRRVTADFLTKRPALARRLQAAINRRAPSVHRIFADLSDADFNEVVAGLIKPEVHCLATRGFFQLAVRPRLVREVGMVLEYAVNAFYIGMLELAADPGAVGRLFSDSSLANREMAGAEFC